MATLETAPLLLSSREEVESIFGADGVCLRIDDHLDGVTDGTGGTPNDTQKLIDALIEASDEGYRRLSGIYSDEQLCQSYWVRRRASYIAAHLVSIRRGNPGQYNREYERAIGDFIYVQQGGFIPRLKPLVFRGPTGSPLVVTHWHGINKVRAIQQSGEGQPDSRQFPDSLVFHGFRGWWW